MTQNGEHLELHKQNGAAIAHKVQQADRTKRSDAPSVAIAGEVLGGRPLWSGKGCTLQTRRVVELRHSVMRATEGNGITMTSVQPGADEPAESGMMEAAL